MEKLQIAEVHTKETLCVKQMVLELLFLGILILGLCVVAYRGAIHEFQILQKDYHPDNNWSELLSEQLPIVIRSLPKHWLGNWSLAKTENRSWSLLVRNPHGKRFRTTWAHWLKEGTDTNRPENMDELAEAARLHETVLNWATEDCRRWSWLSSALPTPYVLYSSRGLTKTTAEYTVIVATDESPLELWIAHEGALSDKVVRFLDGRDPWIQTSETVPWISTVKYIELILRPGNAILLPRHWWYALRPTTTGDRSWYWQSEFHTPISWIATKLRGAPQEADSNLRDM